MANAQAAYDGAVENKSKTQSVIIPQLRRDAEGSLRSAETSLNVAKVNLDRQTDLLNKGYVSQSVVDSAKQTFENAKANFENAQQKMRTIDQEVRSMERSAQLAVDQAQASLNQAKANSSQDRIAQQNLAEARNAVR
ncbi:MAG: TolC family protein, partial [bacterium]|nr:TolC family protein [bacterium]